MKSVLRLSEGSRWLSILNPGYNLFYNAGIISGRDESNATMNSMNSISCSNGALSSAKAFYYCKSRELCSSWKLLIICSVFTVLAILDCWFQITPTSVLINTSINSIGLSLIAPKGTHQHQQIRADTCDLSIGEWVPDPLPPPYTNETCRHVRGNQDCIGNGRPDRGYLHWKWKPRDCDLPRFDPNKFLKLMRNKRMVFIGDSLARNHVESLVCLLAQVEDPDVLYDDGKDRQFQWGFKSYNFTVGNAWSPFLVNHSMDEQGKYRVDLDVPDIAWAPKLNGHDVAIFSTAYWYFRPTEYYVGDHILGANPELARKFPEQPLNNVTTFPVLSAMRAAWRTVLRHVSAVKPPVAIVRTVTVPHFAERAWNDGGACNRTEPDFDKYGNMTLPWMSNEMRKIELEELANAKGRDGDSGFELHLLDITYSSFLRPDGHPGPHRLQHFPNDPRNDCLHWCLPGPVDTWNHFLLQTLIKSSL